MAYTPILGILLAALAITLGILFIRERIPYRAPRPIDYDRGDVERIDHIIAAALPREARINYLGAPERWWFVEWTRVEGCYYACSLDLSGMGLEGELEVSGLTELVRLDCRDNALTSLRLSKLYSLTTLNCRNNQLVSLDLSALSRLTELNCDNNRLISITLPRRGSGPACLYCSDDGPPMVVLPRRSKQRLFYCQNNPLAIIDLPWRAKLVHLPPPKRPAGEAGKTDRTQESI